MKKTGLYFGSFNPVHIGHMAIANYMVEFTDIDQLWFILSPQNPFKKRSGLLADHHRLALLNTAIDSSLLFKASNIEFNMPKPSYTIDTLAYLGEKYPEREFVLIMGSDNLPTFHKWKNFRQIADNYEIYVYPRPGISIDDYKDIAKIRKVEAPLIEISSSFIRKAIAAGKNVSYFMPSKVAEYVAEMHFYEK